MARTTNNKSKVLDFNRARAMTEEAKLCKSRLETARALRQALHYLESEALEANMPFTAHMISIAALSASEIESEN